MHDAYLILKKIENHETLGKSVFGYAAQLFKDDPAKLSGLVLEIYEMIKNDIGHSEAVFGKEIVNDILIYTSTRLN